MAGREKENPKIGVLLMLISPLSDPSKVVQATSYETILLDGALRIVNADGEKITLVSENDLVYEFNVTLRQFVLLPSGSDAILPMTIDAGKIISLGAGLSVSTPTPTITSSPRPTRTPLPTYDPYP